MKEIELLDWDSEFFGFPVARLDSDATSQSEISELLGRLQRSGVRLAYWQTNAEIESIGIALSQCAVKLVDTRRTYEVDLRGSSRQENEFRTQDQTIVLSHKAGMDSDALVDLAIQSGEYSRFRMDSNIPVERFEQLYRQWMLKSISGELADEILVISSTDGSIEGFVSMRASAGGGSIELIAVNSRSRGKGFGRSLVLAANSYFMGRSCPQATVVTQAANVAASKLYETCGYRLKSQRNFYHIWTDRVGFPEKL